MKSNIMKNTNVSKSLIAIIISILLPGYLQFYCKQYKTGIMVLSSYLLFTLVIFMSNLIYSFNILIIYIVFYMFIVIYSLISFYKNGKSEFELSPIKIILIIFSSFIINYGIRTFVVDTSIKTYKIKNNTMEPLLSKGDYILGGKHFKKKELKTDQIIVYKVANKTVVSQIIELNDLNLSVKKITEDKVNKIYFEDIEAICQFVYFSKKFNKIGTNLFKNKNAAEE